jgi:hypothetical protein
VSVLADRLLAVHDALGAADIPHAFGGAIALAYCTHEPRGTRDLDVNVFVPPDRADDVLDALPDGVTVTRVNRAAARREGQVRVMWRDTPIDLFFDTHDFYAGVARDVADVPFEDRTIPVLGCTSLVVFKAMYGRSRDWADIEEMFEAGAADGQLALETVKRLLGSRDESVKRLARTMTG